MTTRLTMITWNVQGHAGVDAPAVAAVLRRARPDVVALQEVQRAQARAIVAALGSPWRLAWGFKHWPVVARPEGVAVLTRHTLAASHVQVLRSAVPVTSHRRIALVADVIVDRPADAGDAGGAEPVRLRVASVHLSPEALRLAWRSIAPARRVIISDAVAALGASPGTYSLAGQAVVSDGTVVRGADGVLAGSATGLDAGVRTVVAATGCALADAIIAATANPAALLGRDDVGALRPGSHGDVTLLDGGLEVAATIVGGAVAYRRGG